MRSATVKCLADEIRAALPLVLDAVERHCDDGPIPLQIAFADFMAESVERRKNPKQRPQRAVGLATHACRQHAQRNVWIVLNSGVTIAARSAGPSVSSRSSSSASARCRIAASRG